MNTTVLIGRSTKEVELRQTNSGKAVGNFSIAVDRDFKNKDGEKTTDFFNIVVWGKTAEYCSKYLNKGKMVAVKGRIENRSYDKDGQTKYITEIIAENVQILEWPDKGEKTETDGEFQVLNETELPF